MYRELHTFCSMKVYKIHPLFHRKRCFYIRQGSIEAATDHPIAVEEPQCRPPLTIPAFTQSALFASKGQKQRCLAACFSLVNSRFRRFEFYVGRL